MELGAFSVSLTVKNLEKSKTFYEKIGFTVFFGELKDNWLIMKNGDHIVGLFHGMIDSNILTFNPGWNQNGETLELFTDIREIHKNLKSQGIETTEESLKEESGPASFKVIDPDGNTILLDQHV